MALMEKPLVSFCFDTYMFLFGELHKTEIKDDFRCSSFDHDYDEMMVEFPFQDVFTQARIMYM
jgi:hypothetical protein